MAISRARVKIEMNYAEINEFLYAPSQPVYRHVHEIAKRTERIATATCPVDTGKLRATIDSDTYASPGVGVMAIIGSASNVMYYVNKGTGIYAGGAPIRAKRAPYMVFKVSPKWPGRNTATVVKGQKPNPFLIKAFKVACPYPVVET